MRSMTIITLSIFLSITVALSSLSNTSFGRTVGINKIFLTTGYLLSAVYWELRAFKNGSGDVDLAHNRRYGSLASFTEKGLISLNIYANTETEVREYSLANITLTDMHGVQKIIEDYKNKPSTFDIYGGSVVVWVDDTPLNLSLIEAGFGSPLMDPNSNVVDTLFAKYYWSLL